jgi:hypothetical protein
MTGLPRIAILPLLLLGACGKKADVTQANFEDGMRTYLERRGDLCLAKTTWPIDVTPHDVAMGTRDAIQMPVFERLGLVRSSDATGEVTTDDGSLPVEVKRYELTEAGLRSYRTREIGVNAAGEKVAAGDLCAAKLSLAKVVGWDLPAATTPGDRRRAVVSYTYEVAAEPWTREPEMERVLPLVAHVVAGAGSAQMKESFTLTADGWVADDLLPGDVRVVSNPPRPPAPGNP